MPQKVPYFLPKGNASGARFSSWFFHGRLVALRYATYVRTTRQML